MTSDPAAPDPADPVFISYRQKDGTGVATELARLLRAAGIPVWRDRDDLPPGDTEARLKQAIAAGISGGVLVTTPDVVNSRVVNLEISRGCGLARRTA
ncbi:toll/interleukin-1 receptor domain-containing protein [Brachybacterium sp. p3-SID1565]|uniref:toll/interleukin-1 receptor domain-containing protein n=1 Tax=Brachybacterium sp. p3-SID1565 TaxID=2916046 RepID=UPI0021A68026|nr:toll/interleukin-1 receptor domain-containing protein [Brachybacterium sp. p3-SID1565]MCT1386249.1 toll/interleukin-1 receptor domain-containing protein [Brachybacterium sp. p3-SID1565]